MHAPGEAEKFYRQFPARIADRHGGDWELPVVCGDWWPRLGHEVWVGDAAKIRASEVRQQKHDRRDAQLLLRLLAEGRFPRIWTPSSEAEGSAAVVDSSLQAGADARAGEERAAAPGDEPRHAEEERSLWSEAGQKVLRELPLAPWASRRREDLFKVMGMLDEQIALLDQAVRGSGREE